jgi:hypothetical protein
VPATEQGQNALIDGLLLADDYSFELGATVLNQFRGSRHLSPSHLHPAANQRVLHFQNPDHH